MGNAGPGLCMRRWPMWTVSAFGSHRRWAIVLLVAVGLNSSLARAQLVSFGLAGSYDTNTVETTRRSYRFGYRQKVEGDFSSTIDYVNEGHFNGHHRDGYAMEGSLKVSTFERYRTLLYVGVGGYLYFDTITDASGTSRDVHGLAPALTLSAAYRVNPKFDVILSLDSVFPSQDFRAHTLSLNVGYWMDGGGKPRALPNLGALLNVPDPSPKAVAAQEVTSGQSLDTEPRGLFDPPPEKAQSVLREAKDAKPAALAGGCQKADVEPDEWALYGAFTVINITGNPKSDGGAAEYRLRLSNCSAYRYDLSLTYLNEGDSRVVRRNGVSAQLWPVRSDALDKVEVAIGIGAYWFVDRRRPVIPGHGPTGSVAPVVSVMISSTRFHDGWFGRVIWDRVVSNYNRDADIWRIGVGHTM